MKLPVIALVTFASLGISVIALRASGDATLLVPPPEAVAESFYRQIAAGRYDRAHPMLSARLRAGSDSLRSLRRALVARYGTLRSVDAVPVSRSDSTAEALVRLSGATDTAALRVALARERHLWKIAGLVS